MSRVIPGFGLSLGICLAWLTTIVLIPLAALAWKSASLSPAEFWATISTRRVLASFTVSFSSAAIAAGLNAVIGLLIAWVLVRYRFPGRRMFDALIDLPFALPTAVAGISLTSLYVTTGWFGRFLPWPIANAQPGIVIALVFVGLPFVVRSVQPVLADLPAEVEEAAGSLGASRFQTITRVILPELVPGLLTGFALAFARGLGEYGSVIFISSNLPYQTEIVPQLIYSKLENYKYAQATALGLVMLMASFLMLLVINLLQRWSIPLMRIMTWLLIRIGR